ncbi:MAG: hypothetical protein QNJ98_17750 [Planctomycetota bacterium]|nr:hypothetical protein [Planctomycetota bacterium]
MTPRTLDTRRSIWITLLATLLRVVLVVWVSLIGPAIPIGIMVFVTMITEWTVTWFRLVVIGFCVLWYPLYRLLRWLDTRYERDFGPSDAEWSQPFE